jgi:hypothetical protein
MFRKIFHIHNITIKLNTNSKFVIDLFCSNLSLFKHFSNSKTIKNITIKFSLCEQNSYRDIPRNKEKDGFWAYPIYQNEYLDRDRSVVEVGPRIVKVETCLSRQEVQGYIVSPKMIEEDLLFDLAFFQPLRKILNSRNMYILHASAVSKNNKCVIFPGETGAGKSTIALALFNSGFNYLGEDDVILKPVSRKIECFAFPTKIRIKEPLLKYFPRLKSKLENSCDGKGKYKLDPRKINPHRIANQCIPFMLVFPRYKKGARISIKRISKTAALSDLMLQDYSLGNKAQHVAVSKRNMKLLSDLVKQCGVFELFYSDGRLHNVPAIIDKLI